LFCNLVDIDSLENLAHCRRADIGVECSVSLVLRFLLEIEVSIFVEQFILSDFLLARLDDDVVRVVNDFFEIAKREVHEIPHWTRKSLEEPDVGDGYGELDVTHSLATNTSECHFDAATIADHTAIPDSLVLSAVAFPVLHGTEDALAEKSILLRLEGAIVDGLRL